MVKADTCTLGAPYLLSTGFLSVEIYVHVHVHSHCMAARTCTMYRIQVAGNFRGYKKFDLVFRSNLHVYFMNHMPIVTVYIIDHRRMWRICHT